MYLEVRMSGFSCSELQGACLKQFMCCCEAYTVVSGSEYECSNILDATRKKSGINNKEKKRDQHLM